MRTLPKHITKNLLITLYVDEKNSCLQVSKIINKSTQQVSRYLQRFGIKARPFSTKGLQPRLGAILSEKTKDKIRKSHVGKKLSSAHKEKIRKWMFENKPTLGLSPSEESREKSRQKMLGRKLTPEHRAKVLKNLEKCWVNPLKGNKHPNWKGGISSISARIRNSKPFRDWKKAVNKRDDYTCKFCKLKSLNNHADHIAPFALFPELRFSVDNGRTLCVKCHHKTNTYGGNSMKKKLLTNSSKKYD